MTTQIGFVYKISTPGSECYIGSTKEGVSHRFVQHRSHWDTWNRATVKKGRCSSFDLFDKYDWNQCDVSVLEVVRYTDKQDLRKAERKWLEETPHTVNKNLPAPTRAEHLAKMKQWRDNNKEYFNNYIHQPVECECGMYVTLAGVTRHRRGDVHARRMAENPLKQKVLTPEEKQAHYKAVQNRVVRCGCGADVRAKEFSNHRKTTGHVIWVQAEMSKTLAEPTEPSQ